MKNVLDAVNEFKGNNPYDWSFDQDEEKLVLQYIGDEKLVAGFEGFCEATFITICTIKEFNQCVKDCSNNFGKETKSALLDENTNQYKISNIGNVLHNMACSMTDENQQNEFGDYASFCWGLASYFRASSVGCVEKSKPVYTKDMQEAGELPPIGVECEVIGKGEDENEEEDNDYYNCKILLHREVEGSLVAVFIIKNYDGFPYYYSHCTAKYFKPLDTRTDSQKFNDDLNTFNKKELTWTHTSLFEAIKAGHLHGVAGVNHNEP